MANIVLHGQQYANVYDWGSFRVQRCFVVCHVFAGASALPINHAIRCCATDPASGFACVKRSSRSRIDCEEVECASC